MNIFLAEDEPILRSIYEKILESAGYLVTSTGDGKEAQMLLREKSFDLILLDVMLPHVDGLQILRRLTKKNTVQQVVLLTNFGKNELNLRLKGKVPLGFLVKSDMNPAQLRQKVEFFLKLSLKQKN